MVSTALIDRSIHRMHASPIAHNAPAPGRDGQHVDGGGPNGKVPGSVLHFDEQRRLEDVGHLHRHHHAVRVALRLLEEASERRRVEGLGGRRLLPVDPRRHHYFHRCFAGGCCSATAASYDNGPIDRSIDRSIDRDGGGLLGDRMEEREARLGAWSIVFSMYKIK